MRRATAIGALIAATGLPACGSSDSGEKEKRAVSTAAPSKTSAAGGQGKSYEVTLEVGGKGTTGTSNIMYNAETSDSKRVKLPWKKTETVTLTSTQRRVGFAMHIGPGNLMLPSGKFVAPSCSITVDGKQVDKDPGGAEGVHSCKYTLH